MQPVIINKAGDACFKGNAIVEWMLQVLEKNGVTLSDFPLQFAEREDVTQFYQLIGYGIEGYSELSRVGGRTQAASRKAAEKLGYPIWKGHEAVEQWKKENGYPVEGPQ